MLATGARHWLPLTRLARTPDRAQAQALRRILVANAATQFGVEHRFGDLSTVNLFRQRVPVQDYETLRPYVETQRRTGAPALTVEPPIFYAQTSGSTGRPKLIPITATALRTHQREQALFAYLQYRACPEAFAGKAFGVMGAATEGRLDSGHLVGSVSGYLYQSLPSVVQSRFVLPPAVSAIADYERKYVVMVRLALAARDISYLGSPNPSTFLRLLDVLNERRAVFARSLETGSLPVLDELEPDARAAVAALLRPDRSRAAELRGNAPLTFESLWPGIKLITTWTGGSCGIALETLRSTLPQRTKVMELGYQATECRGSMALETEAPGGLPPLHHHFFEFVEQQRWDAGSPEFLTLGQIAPGALYYILVTTVAGLYRYFMNDLVEVVGFHRRTPMLRFVQKGRGVTSLTGEKLYEAHVIDAVKRTTDGYGMTAAFFVLVANDARASYTLFIEANDDARRPSEQFAADIDARIGELNVEYQGKRASGRLAPLTIAWLGKGTAEAYRAATVRMGQREGQLKPAVLLYAKDLPMSFDPYVVA
jgi:hypothetical protein